MPPSDSRLVLNVARLSFESQELAATKLPINSQDDFASLTAEYSGTHLVRRFDDHNVLVIPLVKGASEVIGTSTKIALGDLVAALARHALTDYLKSLGRSITWGRPLTFPADTKNDLLLDAANQSPRTCPITCLRTVSI
jgi:hypothetical protein